jgi:hypothetical protein
LCFNLIYSRLTGFLAAQISNERRQLTALMVDFDFGLHVSHVVASDERRGDDAPEAEVRFGFGDGHAAVADFEHVRIIPMVRPGAGGQPGLGIQIAQPAGGPFS